MSTPMAGAPRKHLISVDEYYRMAEVGLLAPDARVELIEGEIIDMVPIGTRHARAVTHLSRLLVLAVGERAIVRSQCPVRLGPRSEPEPDIALLAPRKDEYGRSHPGPSEVLLIIEVSDSTLEYDREVKLPLYARHGIPEAWIVDLHGGHLLIHRVPHSGGYADCIDIPEPGLTPLSALPGVQVDLSRLIQS